MSRLRDHFLARATALGDLATLELDQRDGAVTIRLRPRNSAAIGVVLYLTYDDRAGTVALDDPAAVHAELGEDPRVDLDAIDQTIDVAVEGRATAFHLGRGGCIEERTREGATHRTWRSAWPRPSWRRRAERVDFEPYAAPPTR